MPTMTFIVKMDEGAEPKRAAEALRWWAQYIESFMENDEAPAEEVRVFVSKNDEPFPQPYGVPVWTQYSDGFGESMFYAPNHDQAWKGYVSSEAFDKQFWSCPAHGPQWEVRQCPEGVAITLECGCRVAHEEIEPGKFRTIIVAQG